MARDNEAFLEHLRVTFRVEADEHLQAMATLLHDLDCADSAERRSQLVETLFREAHSLKGAARAVNLSEVEALCGGLESRLAALKSGESTLSPALVETLVLDVDELGRLLAADAAGVRMPAVDLVADHRQAPQVTAPERFVDGGETIRISTGRLSAILVQAEELLAFKSGAGRLAKELREVGAELSAWKKAWGRMASEVRFMRRARPTRGDGIDRRGSRSAERRQLSIGKLFDAVERDELFVNALCDRLARLQCLAEQDQRALGSIADTLQNDMKQALMQPFSTLLELLPKLVRDLARDSGKQVELRIDGAAIEIDRRILEQMKDPLIHLVRNAIDHGIELPAERARRGKVGEGRLTVAITPKEGNQVELVIADDGAGIDLERVVAAALRLGLVAPEEAGSLSRSDALALTYASGLSTSVILTDISGRGLGLPIVREKVEKLGGGIAIESPAGGGTLFRVVLPTTLANFHGLLVAVGDNQFVLPARNVERVARVAPDTIRTVENREAIELGGEAVALARLSDVLGLPDAQPVARGASHLPVAVVASGGRRIAFVVDAVLGDHEVLVKGLGPQLRRVRNIAGATVLGAGRLVPILSVPYLLASARRTPPRPLAAMPARGAAPARRCSLLVVEDSITSRSLLKNILESSGYDVATAVDGIDALTVLRSGRFDLVVSDVEMPRMDGFALTARIRQDRKLADLPVVLVTALESREHRERGIDVGADAYIVKSSFDQSNLLEVIRRLT